MKFASIPATAERSMTPSLSTVASMSARKASHLFLSDHLSPQSPRTDLTDSIPFLSDGLLPFLPDHFPPLVRDTLLPPSTLTRIASGILIFDFSGIANPLPHRTSSRFLRQTEPTQPELTPPMSSPRFDDAVESFPDNCDGRS